MTRGLLKLAASIWTTTSKRTTTSKPIGTGDTTTSSCFGPAHLIPLGTPILNRRAHRLEHQVPDAFDDRQHMRWFGQNQQPFRSWCEGWRLGQDDHTQFRSNGPKRSNGLLRFFGNTKIDHHQIDPRASQCRDGALAVGGLANLVAFPGEEPSEQLSQGGIVVEQQDDPPRWCRRRRIGIRSNNGNTNRPMLRHQRLCSLGKKPEAVEPQPAVTAPQRGKKKKECRSIPEAGPLRPSNVAPATFRTKNSFGLRFHHR